METSFLFTCICACWFEVKRSSIGISACSPVRTPSRWHLATSTFPHELVAELHNGMFFVILFQYVPMHHTFKLSSQNCQSHVASIPQHRILHEKNGINLFNKRIKEKEVSFQMISIFVWSTAHPNNTRREGSNSRDQYKTINF